MCRRICWHTEHTRQPPRHCVVLPLFSVCVWRDARERCAVRAFESIISLGDSNAKRGTWRGGFCVGSTKHQFVQLNLPGTEGGSRDYSATFRPVLSNVDCRTKCQPDDVSMFWMVIVIWNLKQRWRRWSGSSENMPMHLFSFRILNVECVWVLSIISLKI